MIKKLLTIAGSDCSGGAGIQADIKTFSALGAYAMSVISSITAQNTKGITASADISPEMVKAQLDAIFEDILIDGVKIGMVSNIQTIHTISDILMHYQPPNIVLDPVMVSSSGYRLLDTKAIDSLVHDLLPLTTLVTPNIPEAELLASRKIQSLSDVEKALYCIREKGAKNVLIKGGHLDCEPVDTLLYEDNIYSFSSARIDTPNTHGTGCTLSSAICVFLSYGDPMNIAARKAKEYLMYALEYSYPTGHGHGSVNHFWNLGK